MTRETLILSRPLEGELGLLLLVAVEDGGGGAVSQRPSRSAGRSEADMHSLRVYTAIQAASRSCLSLLLRVSNNGRATATSLETSLLP